MINFLMMTKNIFYMIDFLCQIEILLLNMLKIQGFSMFCIRNSRSLDKVTTQFYETYFLMLRYINFHVI